MWQPGHGLSGQRHVSNESYRLLFDWNPQPILVWDAETLHFLAANKAAIRHYGYSQDEFLAMNVESIQPPESGWCLSEFLQNLPTDIDRSRVCRFKTKDGTLIDV